MASILHLTADRCSPVSKFQSNFFHFRPCPFCTVATLTALWLTAATSIPQHYPDIKDITLQEGKSPHGLSLLSVFPHKAVTVVFVSEHDELNDECTQAAFHACLGRGSLWSWGTLSINPDPELTVWLSTPPSVTPLTSISPIPLFIHLSVHPYIYWCWQKNVFYRFLFEFGMYLESILLLGISHRLTLLPTLLSYITASENESISPFKE